MIDQVQRRLPTLVLKLRRVHETSQDDLSGNNAHEQYFQQNINELREILLKNLDDFHKLVSSAKPSKSSIHDPHYAEKEEAYRELVILATVLMEKMKETIKKLLGQYRKYLDDVWDAICAGEDPALIANEFQNGMNILIKNTWDPIFSELNKVISQLEVS